MKSKPIYILNCFKEERITAISHQIKELIDGAMTCAIAKIAEKNNNRLTRENIEEAIDLVEYCVNGNLLTIIGSIAGDLMESLRKCSLEYFDEATKDQENDDDGTTVVFPGECKYEKH